MRRQERALTGLGKVVTVSLTGLSLYGLFLRKTGNCRTAVSSALDERRQLTEKYSPGDKNCHRTLIDEIRGVR